VADVQKFEKEESSESSGSLQERKIATKKGRRKFARPRPLERKEREIGWRSHRKGRTEGRMALT